MNISNMHTFNKNTFNTSNIISNTPSTIKYNLDANAGLPISYDDLLYYTNIETSINNINGWSQEKMSVKEEYLLVKDKLLKTFINQNGEQQYANLYYTFSVGEALRIIYQSILDCKEDMFIYPNQHPHISQITSSLKKCYSQTRLKTNTNTNTITKTNTCLINLLTSQTNEDQTAQLKDAEDKNYIYTVVDASQALGRLNLKQLIHKIDCLILSPRKVGGMSNLCFVLMTKQFEDKFICGSTSSDNIGSKFLSESRFVSMMLSSARQVIDAFPAQNFNLEMNKLQQKALLQQLACYDEYIKVHQLDESVPQTYTSLIIELDRKLCPRLFQQELAKRGIAVGFETACQSNKSNKIRLSWREIYDDIDISQELAQVIEVCENDAENAESSEDNTPQNQLSQNQISQKQLSQNPLLFGGAYKLKLQQDKQYDLKQGARNISMFNRRLFYLRGHWVPLNTDDNKYKRYKIPVKYAVMFQNFVLQQQQDYYLYIPELKEEFKNWMKAKKEENYQIENLYDEEAYKRYIRQEKENQKEDGVQKQKSNSKEDSKEDSNETEQQTEEQYLEMFEYLYRVSKHIYLTPSLDEHPDNTIALDDFEFDEKASRYPKLPDDFIQLFENTARDEQQDEPQKESQNKNQKESHNKTQNSQTTQNILYPMTYTKYKRCLKDNIDLNEEYINNPSSEFVIKMKLPIQQHFINYGNSYVHSMSKQLIYEPSDDQDKDASQIKPTQTKNRLTEKRLTVEERLEQVNPKYVQVIQPGRPYLNETAIELTKEIVKDNAKTKIVLIIHNPTIEQQEEIFKQGFEEVRQKILSYQNWFQQWYYDDNIYTYVRNIKV